MSNCYVYFLYDKDNIVRYVGMGRRDRFRNIKDRNSEYLDVLNNGGRVEKVIDNLSVCEALDIERESIEKHKSTIINKISGNKYNYLYWRELSEIFALDNESPSGIIWAVDRFNISKTIKARKGSPAGSLGSCGYWSVPFNGKYIKVHRIIMSIYYKVDILSPDILINHIDGNRSNNNIENLEWSSHRHNALNKVFIEENKFGVSGVSTYENRGILYFKARFSIETGKRFSKDFSTNKYGYDEAYRLACEWRKQMEELYYK